MEDYEHFTLCIMYMFRLSYILVSRRSPIATSFERSEPSEPQLTLAHFCVPFVFSFLRMAGSSELSNALNPNYYLTRTTNEPSNFPGGNTIGQPSYSQPGQHYAGPSNPYMTGPSVGHSQPIQAHAHIPHRSELADAINPDHVARPVAPNVVPLQQ